MVHILDALTQRYQTQVRSRLFLSRTVTARSKNSRRKLQRCGLTTATIS